MILTNVSNENAKVIRLTYPNTCHGLNARRRSRRLTLPSQQPLWSRANCLALHDSTNRPASSSVDVRLLSSPKTRPPSPGCVALRSERLTANRLRAMEQNQSLQSP